MLENGACCCRFPIRVGMMAGIAGDFEGAGMRITMTRRTIFEFNTPVLHRLVHSVSQMAFVAGNLCMDSVESIPRLFVIELSGVLPIQIVMTSPAALRQLPPVSIRMTARAVAGESEKSARRVFYRDDLLFHRGYQPRPMACAAGNLRVPAFQPISCAVMIEVSDQVFPIYHLKRLSVMIRVALDARCFIPVFSRRCEMQTSPLRYSLANVSMALEALESGRALAVVAIGTMTRATQ